MNNQNNTNRAKKPLNTFGIVIALIMIFNVLGIVSETGTLDLYFIIGLLTVVLFVVLFAIGIKSGIKNIKKKSENPDLKSYKNPDADVEERVYTPRQDNYSKRTYYESSEVFDNRKRDKKRRIAQLKVFLDNGIIEKDEYNVLLRKYESES